MRTRVAQTVRNRLDAIASELAGQRVTSAQLVEILRARYQSDIDADLNEIVQLGLMRLAGDVGRAPIDVPDQMEMDLGDDYGIRRHVFLWFRSGEKWGRLHTSVDELTAAELREHAAKLTHAASRRSDPAVGYLQLAEDMESSGGGSALTVAGYWATRELGRKKG